MDSQNARPPTPDSHQESNTSQTTLCIRLRQSDSTPSDPEGLELEQHQVPQQNGRSEDLPAVEESRAVKTQAQDSSDDSAPALPDQLTKTVEIYKQTETRCPLSVGSLATEKMAPKKSMPTSILRRTASSDINPRERPSNSPARIQFVGILKRPGQYPAEQAPNVTKVKRGENKRPTSPFPDAVAIPTTIGNVAHGAPVERSRVEPSAGFADPTDHRYFWKYYGREMDPSPYQITQRKAIRRMVQVYCLTQRHEPEDKMELEDVDSFMFNSTAETRRSLFIWKHRKKLDKNLGQLVDVEAHYTMRGNEDMIQAPPQIIQDADFLNGPGDEIAVMDTDGIPLGSLSLYEYPDWKTRDDWRTWRMVAAAPAGSSAKPEKKYEDCTREQMVWIEMMYCSVRKLGDVRLGSTDVKNMFREKFGCEIPRNWKGFAAEIARDASRKMLKYRIGMARV